jgi:hypothetical protein
MAGRATLQFHSGMLDMWNRLLMKSTFFNWMYLYSVPVRNAVETAFKVLPHLDVVGILTHLGGEIWRLKYQWTRGSQNGDKRRHLYKCPVERPHVPTGESRTGRMCLQLTGPPAWRKSVFSVKSETSRWSASRGQRFRVTSHEGQHERHWGRFYKKKCNQ